MAIGFTISAIKRAKLNTVYAGIALVLVSTFMFYMFLLAN